MRLGCATVCALLAVPLLAHAQGGTGFVTGPISWRPTIALRDVGVDNNVFDELVDPKEDRIGTLSPSVDVTVSGSRVRLDGGFDADFVYFERNASQRAFNRAARLRLEVPLRVLTPFVSGDYERALERQGTEINLRARREGYTGTAGLSWAMTPRGTVRAEVAFNQVEYDAGQTFRGLQLADELNRETQSASAGFLYALARADGVRWLLLRIVLGAVQRQRASRAARSCRRLDVG